MAGGAEKTRVNRAPVPTLRAAVVAERWALTVRPR